ncbi:hypothetical protein FHR76_001616 [Rhizobium sp. RAS22]|nr:hypothetical protein [Rhizobium sp. RAS22]
MKVAICMISLAAVLLSGCTYAAKQVLGEQAVPINPTKAQRLDTAKIFRVKKDGRTYPICQADLDNRAIKAITVETVEDSNDVVADKISGENISFVLPGVTFRVPYYKTQVSGYVHKRALWPSNDDFYTYFRKGVGDNCRKLIDGGNVLIIEQEARAKKSSQIFKGPVDGLAVGPGRLAGIGAEQTIRAPNNVTFGIIPAEK